MPPPAHVGLEARLSEVVGFRNAHDQLRDVLVKVLTAAQGEVSAAAAERELRAAYEQVCNTRPLEMSEAGAAAWDAARRPRCRRADRPARGGSRGGAARAAGETPRASEMFRVCATFNPLFSRPRIRETVAEFQERLIEVVRRDLDALTERFKTSGAARAQAALLSRLRGVADVASTIRWARQLEGRLNAHMSNLQAVLGGRGGARRPRRGPAAAPCC